MNFAQKIVAEKQALMGVVEQTTRQFCTDTCHIALNRCKEQWGYQRIMEFQKIWDEVQAEYEGLLNHGPEQDFVAELMQRELVRIAKDPERIIPHEKRYPGLKQPDYRGRRERYGH